MYGGAHPRRAGLTILVTTTILQTHYTAAPRNCSEPMDAWSARQPITINPSVMTLSIFEYGDGRFRLNHGDREVGWVENRAVGFVGFSSEEEAVRAATTAYDALGSWLARQRRQEAAPRRGRRLRVRSEAGDRQLMLGEVPIGRLVSGPVDQAPEDASYGFELMLPPRVGAALTVAHIINQALVRHRALRSLESVPLEPADATPSLQQSL